MKSPTVILQALQYLSNNRFVFGALLPTILLSIGIISSILACEYQQSVCVTMGIRDDGTLFVFRYDIETYHVVGDCFISLRDQKVNIKTKWWQDQAPGQIEMTNTTLHPQIGDRHPCKGNDDLCEFTDVLYDLPLIPPGWRIGLMVMGMQGLFTMMVIVFKERKG